MERCSITFYCIAQTLSLIDHSTEDSDAGGKPTPTHPVLDVSLLVRVWPYGLESRTSKLGVVVAILG